MSDKVIKIAFAVDTQSAAKAKSLIEDLTRSVDRLVQSATRAGGALGGIGGGGGVSVTGKKTIPGLGGATHASAAAAAKSGIVGSILGTDASAVRGIVSGTEQAFGKVGSSIKAFTDRAASDVSRLQRAVDGLKGTMGGLGGSTAGGRAGGGPPTIPDMTGFAKPVATTGQMIPGGGRGGFLFNKYVGGLSPQATEQLNQGNARGFATSFGGFSTLAAAAYGGFKFGDRINGFLEDERSARVGSTLNEPFYRVTRRAEMAQPFLQMHGAAVGRNASLMSAYSQAMGRDDIQKSLRSNVLRRETVEHTLRTMTAKGAGREMLNDIRNWMGAKTGYTTDDVTAFINGLPVDEVTKKTARDVLRERSVAELGPQAAKQLQEAAQGIHATMDPTQKMMLDEVYGNAAGRVRTMRGMGMSTGDVTLPGGVRASRMEMFQAKLNRGGWDFGDYAAGRSQLLQSGLGYGKAVGPIGLVSAGIGGMSNAAQLLQTGGTMGGSVGAGNAFYRAAQRSVGRGGLDVAVGRDLFGSVGSQALASGQFGGAGATDYASYAAGLVGGGAGVPLDVGGQQRRAGMLASGTAAFGGFTSGRAAPLYQATSLMGAVGATGGYGAGAEALTKMSPQLLTQMARGGAVPEWAQSLGLGQGEADKFLKYQRKAPLFEVTDELVGGRAGDTLAKVRGAEAGGGDFMDVVRGATKGLKGKKKADAAMRVAEDLGAAMFASGLVESPEAGAGVFLGQMAQDQEFAPALKGKGVGAAGPGGAEAEALKKQAEVTEKLARAAGGLEKAVAGLKPTEMMTGSENALKAINAGSAGGGLDGSIETVIAALAQFQGALRGAARPGARPSGPVKTK